MMPFEELVSNLEAAIEDARQGEDKAKSYLAALIFERLDGVQNAIDDWRQG